MAYIYDLTDTWNAGGTTFNGIKLNVTDSASAVSSKLMALQTNGTEHFSVTKAGVGYFSGNVGIGTSSPAGKIDYISGSARVYMSNQGSSAFITAVNTTNTAYAPFALNGSELILKTGDAERMRIDGSGNLGVGTTVPNYKLETNGIIASYRPSAGQAGYWIYNGGATAEWFTGQRSGTDHAYKISQVAAGVYTDRVIVDTSGNLLVGTTSTSYAYTDTSMRWLGSSGGILLSQNTTSNVNQMAFFNPNGAVGSINTNGSSTIFATSSDVRLKHDIVDAPEASSLIDAMQVRSFKWNANNSEQRYGFVAQELVTVAPEAVNQPADPDAMMGVDYSKLVPMLVKELQSLRARVAQLEGN